MDIYVVYYIDWDWHQTKRIVGVFSSWVAAKELINVMGDDDVIGYMISNQKLDEEFTVVLM